MKRIIKLKAVNGRDIDAVEFGFNQNSGHTVFHFLTPPKVQNALSFFM